MNEISSKSLKIPAEFAEELSAELYQSEITLQAGPDSRLYSQRKGGSLGMEQLRMLQVHLTEINSQRPFKRLLVTSATRGEGKTHIATNLALALASEGHQRVLLIDADLRNPSVHLAYGVPNTYGFKDWLVSGGSPWKAVRKVKRTELYLMTGGTAACESIDPSRVADLQTQLEQLSPAFDLILLDGPPVLGTVDTKLLCSVTDSVLLVIGTGVAPRDLVLEAQESLEGQNVLGVVLNRLDPNQPCFATYYHYTYARQEPARNGNKGPLTLTKKA